MPAKKQSRRPSRKRRKVARWKKLLWTAVVAALGLPLGWATLARWMAPQGNADRTRFDAIVVFGYPADKQGNPSAIALARVQEAVREYERGVAPRLILTGGAAHNAWVESRAMAQAARAQGLPDSVLFLDTESRDTIQNGCQALKIMQAHGWQSAELISDAEHLPRIGMIFEDLPLDWRVHAAAPLRSRPMGLSAAYSAVEVLKTARYLFWTRSRERCQP